MDTNSSNVENALDVLGITPQRLIAEKIRKFGHYVKGSGWYLDLDHFGYIKSQIPELFDGKLPISEYSAISRELGDKCIIRGLYKGRYLQIAPDVVKSGDYRGFYPIKPLQIFPEEQPELFQKSL